MRNKTDGTRIRAGSSTRTKVLVLCVVVMYALHQDFWNWRTAHPVLLGLFPVGLSYHIAYTIVAALLMGILARFAWPGHLEDSVHEPDQGHSGQRP